MTTQHVVSAAKFARALYRPNVGCFLHHTEKAAIPPRIHTDPAGIGIAQITADRAHWDVLGHGVDRAGKAADGVCWLFEQIVGKSSRRLPPNPGQFRQLGS